MGANIRYLNAYQMVSQIMMEDPYLGSPISYVERENLEDSSYSIAPKEQVELVERSLKEPLDKRRYAWC